MIPIQNMFPSLIVASVLLTLSHGEHHMKSKPEKRQNSDNKVPLIVSNQCRETIHPGILTQSGTGPSESG